MLSTDRVEAVDVVGRLVADRALVLADGADEQVVLDDRIPRVHAAVAAADVQAGGVVAAGPLEVEEVVVVDPGALGHRRAGPGPWTQSIWPSVSLLRNVLWSISLSSPSTVRNVLRPVDPELEDVARDAAMVDARGDASSQPALWVKTKPLMTTYAAGGSSWKPGLAVDLDAADRLGLDDDRLLLPCRRWRS